MKNRRDLYGNARRISANPAYRRNTFLLLQDLVRIIRAHNIEMVFIDLFAGAGGVSEGIYIAMVEGKRCAIVCYAVNHDYLAIGSHAENHPYAFHADEDIRNFDLSHMLRVVTILRMLFPGICVCVWASLECTNFSKAKGGLPRDADSRTLALHLYRYIFALDPDMIWIENVVEFMSWGPLDVNGKPESKTAGVDFTAWKEFIIGLGYKCEHHTLDSANYGAYTSRRRLFMQFAKPGISIVWPDATHEKRSNLQKEKTNPNLFDVPQKMPHKAVKEVLDFTDEGTSIFSDLYPRTYKQAKMFLQKKVSKKTANRKTKKVLPPRTVVIFPATVKNPTFGMEPKKVITDLQANIIDELRDAFLIEHNLTAEQIAYFRYDSLAVKSFERVEAGLIKFVAGGQKAYLTKCHSSHNNTKVNSGSSVGDPAPTISTQNRINLVQPAFLSKGYSGDPYSKNISIYGPAHTITAVDHHSLVQPSFLLKYNSMAANGRYNPPSVDEPCPVIATQNRIGLVQTKFLTKAYGNGGKGGQVSSAEEPAGTLTTKDRFAVVQTHWLDKQYSGSANHQSIDQPAGTIMTNDKHGLITAEHFINRPFTSGGYSQSVEDAAGSITGVPKLNLVTVKKDNSFILPGNYANPSKGLDGPAPTIMASRRHHYLVNPQWGNQSSSIENACFTLIARMDKAPPYLVATEFGELAIHIYESDPPVVRRIKEFMAVYGIIDIKMRMLKVSELKAIQGFKPDYVLLGTLSDQKKFIGNSVPPIIVRSMIIRSASEIRSRRKAVRPLRKSFSHDKKISKFKHSKI